MKKLIVVLVVLFIGILFAGCTSQSAASAATPTPTAVPTTVATPVPTVIPTAIVTPNVTANVTVNVTATPTATPAPQNVKMITFTKDLTITPDATVYVPVGTKVSWLNNDPFKPHGIQATNVMTQSYFGDRLAHQIAYGSMFNVTFDKAGSYEYTTVFQPQITAKIIVS